MKVLIKSMLLFGALICLPLSAETFVSKDWVWSTDNSDFYYAVTVNSAGNIIGQYCYFESGSCMYIVGVGITCDEDHQYPALINSNVGSAQVNLICAHKYENQNVLFINGFDEIDKIVRTANRMGIVIPMEDGQFKVARFSLAGSTYAIDLMRAAAELQIGQEPQKVERKDEEYL